jgi:stage II sporulation protein D
VSAGYLRGPADSGELLRWAGRLAALSRRERLKAPPGDATRLPAFARLISSAIYGDGRVSLLLPPADIDYILSGLASADVTGDARADVALLLKEGIMRVPPEGRITARAAVTRAYAIETAARAILSRTGLSGLVSQTAKMVEANRLVISEGGSSEPDRLAVESGAWLFRRLGGESYAVESLALVGGERVTYHLNAAGRIDFLEAEVSERGASSDRYSNLSRWRERVTPDELRRRLARANISVGEIEELLPVAYGASNRVLDLEIVGREGRQRLRGFRIRTSLGLKETLFVVDVERDERGRAVAFTFTGRGWGHGVGLCQTGAYGLAKEGYSSTAILQKYYTGVKVQKIY